MNRKLNRAWHISGAQENVSFVLCSLRQEEGGNPCNGSAYCYSVPMSLSASSDDRDSLLGSWPPLGLTHPPCSGIFMVHPSLTSSFIHIHCIATNCQELSWVLGKWRWVRRSPCPQGATVKWGRRVVATRQGTCARWLPHQKSHARTGPKHPVGMLCLPLWLTVHSRTGSKLTLPFHHPPRGPQS